MHHSAGDYATIGFLQQVHRDRQPGDLVIDNGNGLGMGEIASDLRQEYDLWGGHVSAGNMARNFLGIGICLVGHFDNHGIPEPQFEALVTLTKYLMDEFDIPPENVNGHGLIEGESTRCPGSRFLLDGQGRAIA